MDRIVIDQAASSDALLVRYFGDANINRLFKQVATQQAYNLIRRPARRETERRVTAERAAEIKYRTRRHSVSNCVHIVKMAVVCISPP